MGTAGGSRLNIERIRDIQAFHHSLHHGFRHQRPTHVAVADKKNSVIRLCRRNLLCFLYFRHVFLLVPPAQVFSGDGAFRRFALRIWLCVNRCGFFFPKNSFYNSGSAGKEGNKVEGKWIWKKKKEKLSDPMSFPILYPVLIQFSIKAPQTRFFDLFLRCVPVQEERAFVNSEKSHDACFFLHAYTSGNNPVQEGSAPWGSIHGSCYAHRYQLKDVRYAGNHSDLPGHGALYARLRQLRR
jgi:hypothetical protein